MSSFPIILDIADGLDCDDLLPFYREPLRRRCYPSAVPSIFRQLCRLEKDLTSVSPVGKDGFQVCMDVSQFKPSEMTVKVAGQSVTVEAKHEEREDAHGFISRHFVRRYTLPKGYDPDKLVSTLSSDGVLTVSVPKPQIESKSGERIIQIQQTGPAHQNIKENSKEDEEKKKEDEKKEDKKKGVEKKK